MKKRHIFTNIIIFILIILLILYSLINYLNINLLIGKEMFNNYFIIGLILIAILLLLSLINDYKNRNHKYKETILNSLMTNSDTIYIVLDDQNSEVLFLSDNTNEVLGIDKKDDKEKIVSEILNIPILRSELKNWDGKSEYVSQMLAYNSPKYQHTTWIKVKIYPYKEKDDNYDIIQISNANKEHDRQHLLITQTSDIKTRERQLNQITANSYDVEFNLNLVNKQFELKYLKSDMKYFGNEIKGDYETIFPEIVEQYINKNDQETILKEFSYSSLIKLVKDDTLDPISVRYRIGNEIKDNIWLESTVFFITNKEEVNASILTKNVTENAESIREQNIQLQNALNEAKNANNAKTEMLSTISHDIRTPMTTIKGLSDSLLEKNLDTTIKDDIDNINEASKEVISIIDSLLDISKIEKRVIKKEEKNYSILELITKVVNEKEEFIDSKNVSLNVNIDNNLPVILYGDNKRIAQTLANILDNSIKYTKEGKIDINVKGEKINNHVNLTIEISDTGCGISNNKLKKIFEVSKKQEETGLIKTKKIIDLLGGTIEIESKEGEYTKVSITLMQKIVEDNKIREMIKNNKKAEEFDLSGKKVLIVDDNKLNLKVTKRLLEPYSLDITLLESGEECIELIKEQNNFDLILLDQMMPGLDGITTLNKLKEIPEFNTPVVALTADAINGQKEKYLSNGFDDYISKPIDKVELSGILKKFLKNQ